MDRRKFFKIFGRTAAVVATPFTLKWSAAEPDRIKYPESKSKGQKEKRITPSEIQLWINDKDVSDLCTGIEITHHREHLNISNKDIYDHMLPGSMIPTNHSTFSADFVSLMEWIGFDQDYTIYRIALKIRNSIISFHGFLTHKDVKVEVHDVVRSHIEFVSMKEVTTSYR